MGPDLQSGYRIQTTLAARYWYPLPDSNRHVFRQQILSLVRLPLRQGDFMITFWYR